MRTLPVALLVLASCCAPSYPRTPSSRSYEVAVASGDGQSGPVGAACPLPLTARVTDRLGLPARGVEVAFEGPFRGEAFYAWTGADGTASAPAVPPAVGTWTITAQAWAGQGTVATFSITGTK